MNCHTRTIRNWFWFVLIFFSRIALGEERWNSGPQVSQDMVNLNSILGAVALGSVSLSPAGQQKARRTAYLENLRTMIGKAQGRVKINNVSLSDSQQAHLYQVFGKLYHSAASSYHEASKRTYYSFIGTIKNLMWSARDTIWSIGDSVKELKNLLEFIERQSDPVARLWRESKEGRQAIEEGKQLLSKLSSSEKYRLYQSQLIQLEVLNAKYSAAAELPNTRWSASKPELRKSISETMSKKMPGRLAKVRSLSQLATIGIIGAAIPRLFEDNEMQDSVRAD